MATRMARVLGRIDEFDPQREEIATYLERLQLYLIANEVAEDQQVAVLLVVVGSKVYDTLRSLVAPVKPSEKTLAELLELLQKHYAPKPLIIAERFRFYRHCQKPGEPVADFLAELRRLSIRCEFGDFLDQALRDRLVCGVTNPALQKRLLSEASLTLTKALELAQGMEAADAHLKEMGCRGVPGTSPGETVHYTGPIKKPCYRCGRKHSESECKFKSATCHKCGKPGHIAPVCRSKPLTHDPRPQGPPTKKTGKPKGGTKWVGTDSTDTDDPLAMFTLNGPSPQPPIVVTMEVWGKSVAMEVDTGATVSVISEEAYQALFPDQLLQTCTMALKTYTGEPMQIRGEVHVTVRYQDQGPFELPLVVIKGRGPTLLGRNWLYRFRLDWTSIKAVLPGKPLDRLLQEYNSVFNDEVGTISPMKVKLSVSETAKPRFHRPRPVPFALRARVDEELDRLEDAGVLEKVNFSEWAAPIVVVPKKDGRVRICGDYKVTINPVLDIEQYPLLRADDLFATLAGGKYFSTLDLSHAYNQLVVDEDSRDYLTINTHRGLYRYTRLPFGVASAPAIFQKTMDQILRGIDGVICYLDDILITGSTEEEHLERLRQVLKRLEEHGIRVKRSKCFFLRPSVQYLGHLVDADGLHATDDKLKAITEARAPKNLPELRSFLGLLNYYGRFIPKLSTIVHPLNQLQCPGDGQQLVKKLLQQPRDSSLPPKSLYTMMSHYLSG